MLLITLFAEQLLPVFLAAAAGYVLAATLRPDPRPLAHLVFFILAPCLIFRLIIDNRVPGEAMLRMVGFTFAALLTLAFATWLIARWLAWSRTLTAAVVLLVMLPNSGNFGLSANHLAFGEEGLAHAGLYFVAASILTYTVGVFVASLGRASLRASLAGLPRVPVIWAVVLAFLMVGFDARLPGPLDDTVRLLADGCIPVFLVLLGVQLQRAHWRGPWGALSAAVVLRLVGGPLTALAGVAFFGLDGVSGKSAVLQNAMPSAVICIVLATEYDIEPEFATAVVFVSTLASPFTLTPLLGYLAG